MVRRMKIANIEAWTFRYPTPADFHSSWIPGYATRDVNAVIYRLRTDEGLEGICGGIGFLDEAKGPVSLLKAYMLGLDVEDIEEVHGRLKTLYQPLGIRAWFLEVAFWDIRGKSEGRSIAELLGAERQRVRAYASTGEAREASAAADHAKEVVAQGFRGIKIRPRHAKIEEDIAMVKAVREAIGDDIALMCDGNQAWRVDTFAKGPVWDLDRAIAVGRAMEEYDVVWLEEPLDMYDFKGYAELRKRTKTPIAAGELHGDPRLVHLLMDADGVDIVQPDLVFTGGITGAYNLAQEAHRRGLGFAPHTWTNGMGLAANLQVAAASPNCEWLEFPFDPPGWVPEVRDAMLSEPIAIDEDGYVAVPGPGLGVSLDEAKLKEFGTLLT